MIAYKEFDFLGIKGNTDDLFQLLVMWGIFIACYVVIVLIIRIGRLITYHYPKAIDYPFMNINKEHKKLRNSGYRYFSEANDERLVAKESKLLRTFSIIMFVLLAFSTVASILDEGMQLDSFGFIIAPFMLLSFLEMLSGFIYPDKYVIFNRMKGTITIYSPILLPPITIPFKKAMPCKIRASPSVGILHPIFFVLIHLPFDDWGFYLWYMDKNRPLPKWKLLDPYREKDFKRRQAEGFPPPIYKSHRHITDDRVGYFYATDEFEEKVKTARQPVIDSYNRVYYYILENEKKEIKEEDIVLVGIWQNNYVFRLNVPSNPKLCIFEDDENLSGSYLVNIKNHKISIYL